MNFSKNKITDFISAILRSKAPNIRRMIDHVMDFVENLVRMQKSFALNVRTVTRPMSDELQQVYKIWILLLGRHYVRGIKTESDANPKLERSSWCGIRLKLKVKQE
jgi:hypothetical protein